MITRADAEALIPEDASQEIFKAAVDNSVVMRLGRRLANMSRGQRRLPILSALPLAYFVDGTPGDVTDSPSGSNALGFKQTTTAEWKNKYIYAEEIATIVPIAISTLEDADYDIWAEIKPYIGEAFGALIDAAVLHGTSAPATWPTDVVAAAIAAGNTLTLGAIGDLYDDIMGYDNATLTPGLISHVELDGYMPNGFVAGISMRGRLRGLRDTGSGLPLFRPAMTGMSPDTAPYTIDGIPTYFPLNGAYDETESLMICGDWSKLVYAFRTDLTYKVLDQAVIQDPDTGAIIYNLAQQDMVALRCYMRWGWQVPNPINRVNQTEATRYPFSVLQPYI
jgi:HK97 family phage major capsid protein